MPSYVIGLPGHPIRMAIRVPDTADAARQLNVGEVYVEVSDIAEGSISGDGTAFLPCGPDLDMEQARIRATRTARLAASDWTQLLDATISDEERQAWAAYRQTLRDLPEHQSCPLYADVVWPEPPTG